MKILVTIKHIGIKKLLLPALNKIKDINFDVFLNDKNGLTELDDVSNLNLIIKRGAVDITYPRECNLKESFEKVGIRLDTYDGFIMGGLTSVPHLLKEFKKKLYIYTVAPFYRANTPPEILANVNSYRNNSNTLIIHSTPFHYNEYKKRYENKFLSNTILLAHGLDSNAWGNWNGKKKEIVTFWGGYKSRIANKRLKFKDNSSIGFDMIDRLVKNYKHSAGLHYLEADMRQALRNFRLHLFFMKDQQTIGLVESLRIGIPIVGTKGPIVDTDLFMNKENGFISNDGDFLREQIIRIMEDDKYAGVISRNAQDTCDTQFNFNRYVRNWETILKSKMNEIKIEQPNCYRKFK